ncbi:Cof-type HAD-IIB family hydrolase [Liquorilactobacillus uvarum]|uniref:HAD superfamily hydrolase n=1 Tax=Liquorilactobacillus uvarum DSM 19971 TaxID=1423812 RepID=A0A0R1Q6B1_9LACO|nr:Cof-type HAD-IIB family hydrolase [Liquorilactobacillus uvarum]KRL37861.1 hypothetical protein FD20_GL002397 [Liquorilactobacillus uvarum DSM 19971]
MNIKMIAVDMDGTFLNDHNTYDQERFKKIFKYLKQRGIHFVAASGSQFQRLQMQFSPFKDDIDYISQNGSLVHCGSQLALTAPIQISDYLDLLKKLETNFTKKDLIMKTISGINYTYAEKSLSDKYLAIIKRYYSSVKSVVSLKTLAGLGNKDQLIKVGVTFAPDANFEKASAKLRNLLPPTLTSLNSGFNTQLVGTANVDKRTGIKYLQEKYQIKNDEIMTFGDNENDIQMLELTPYSFAMHNASSKIKNIAKNITFHDNNHSGVLDVLEKALMK